MQSAHFDLRSLGVAAIGIAMVYLAGLVRGFSGFGFSIAAVPLLSLLHPPAEVVPVVMMMQLFISFSGLRPALAEADRGSLPWLGLGALIATPLGLWGLLALPPGPVRLIIAAVVALAVVILATGRRLEFRPGPATTFGFGIASGLFNGLAGMPGPPVIAYYLASPLRTSEARASMIVLFLFTSIVALVPLIIAGRIGVPSLVRTALALPAVWYGSQHGARLYLRSPDAQYRRVALLILGVSAALAAGRALLDDFS